MDTKLIDQPTPEQARKALPFIRMERSGLYRQKAQLETAIAMNHEKMKKYERIAGEGD